MKLNKDICKNCINDEKKKRWEVRGCFSFSSFKWGQKEEDAWEANFLWCPFAKNIIATKTRAGVIKNNKIPDECKYKLEQLLITNETN